jgi:hypothetical protein
MLYEILTAAKESFLKIDETLDDIFNSQESGFSYRSSSTSTTSTTTSLPDDGAPF